MENKTILEWLNTLKEPVRQEAIENYEAYFSKNQIAEDNEKENSLESSLGVAFKWVNTKQGRPYWRNIHDNIKDYIQ